MENEGKLAFILCTSIIFLGVGGYMLILNNLDLVKVSEDPTFKYGINTFNDPRIKKSYPDFWVISFNDRKITNIENIIIYIFILWGFLRLIDLMRCLEKYKNE